LIDVEIRVLMVIGVISPWQYWVAICIRSEEY
jgi:hypothetical protein